MRWLTRRYAGCSRLQEGAFVVSATASGRCSEDQVNDSEGWECRVSVGSLRQAPRGVEVGKLKDLVVADLDGGGV